MKMFTMIIAIVVSMIMVSSVNASLISSYGGGGGSGGGSGNSDGNSGIDLGYLRVWGDTGNWDGRAHASMSGQFNQGDYYFSYKNSHSNFYFDRDKDNNFTGAFRYYSSISVQVVKLEDYIPDYSLNVNNHLNVDVFDIEFSSYSNIQNSWDWDNEKELPIITDGIDFSFSMNLSNAEMLSGNLSIRDWSSSDEYNNVINMLGIGYEAYGLMSPEQAAILASMPEVPEPATLLLLGLGGLSLLRRRK